MCYDCNEYGDFRYNYDHRELPTQLTIMIGPGSDSEFEATSPSHSTLIGHGVSPEAAVSSLLYEIVHARPLATEVVEAFRGHGWGGDVIAAWDDATRYGDRDYRDEADAAVSALDAYVARGVPEANACEFFKIDVSATEAAQIHAAGGSADEVRAYRRESATHKWWKWDFDIMPWLLAGIPCERGRLYAYDCTVEEALAWERIVAKHHISDDNVTGLIRLGLTREQVEAGFPVDRAWVYASGGIDKSQIRDWEAAVAKHAITDESLGLLLRLRATPDMLESGFRVDRARFYAGLNLRADRAMQWERVIAEFGIPDSDMRDVLRAGYTPESVAGDAAARVGSGTTVGESARAFLASKSDSGSAAGPWAAPTALVPDPWATPAREKPHF